MGGDHRRGGGDRQLGGDRRDSKRRDDRRNDRRDDRGLDRRDGDRGFVRRDDHRGDECRGDDRRDDRRSGFVHRPRDYEHCAPRQQTPAPAEREAPVERKRLVLAPRTVPLANLEPLTAAQGGPLKPSTPANQSAPVIAPIAQPEKSVEAPEASRSVTRSGNSDDKPRRENSRGPQRERRERREHDRGDRNKVVRQPSQSENKKAKKDLLLCLKPARLLSKPRLLLR
jgi:hypothetical protein